MRKSLAFVVIAAGIVLTANAAWAVPQASGTGAQSQTPAATNQQPTAQPDQAGAYYHFMLARRYQELAGIYNRSDFVDQAVAEYKKAMADDPTSLFLRIQLATLYSRISRVGDAINEAESVLKVDPNYLEAHRLLGDIYLRSMGENQDGKGGKQSLGKAIEQYEDITRINPKDVESFVLLGRLYALNNQNAKAEAAFRSAMQADPNSHNAATYLAKLYLDQNQYQRAIDILKKVPEKDVDGSTLAMLGMAYAQLHQYPKAVEAYKQAVAADPENQDLRRSYAETLMRSGKMDEAREQFREATHINPEDGQSYLRLAQIDQAQGKFDQAREELMHAKNLMPDDLEVPYQQALLENAVGNDDHAIQILTDLLKRSESTNGQYTPGEANNRAIFLERLGRIYRSQEKYDLAMQQFQKIIALGDAQAPQGEGLIVETLRLEGHPRQALKEASDAHKKYPDDQSLALLEASILGEQGHVDEAIKKLQKLMTGKPGDADIELSMVQVYSQAKRYSEAQALVQKVLAEPNLRTSTLEFAKFLLGSVYERQKNYPAAESQFKEVLATDPLNAAAFNYLGYIMADRGTDLEQSVKYIQQALAIEPNNGAYWDSLGWAYYKMARYDLAQAPLEKAAHLLGSDPTVLDHLGQLYLQLGKKQEAAAQWQKALELWPKAVDSDFDAAQAAKVKKQLKELQQSSAKH
jgi:tetratricopeptide (TPR) repeat protein